MQKRIKDLSPLPSVPANGNLVVDTTSGTGKVTIEDIKDYILEDSPTPSGDVGDFEVVENQA